MKRKRKLRKPRVKIEFNVGTKVFSDKKKVIERRKKYKKELVNADIAL